MEIENLRLSKNMKYEALYWALGFEELNKGFFTKIYDNLKVKIDVEKQIVYFDKLSIISYNKVVIKKGGNIKWQKKKLFA